MRLLGLFEVYRTFEPFEKRHLVHPSLLATRQNGPLLSPKKESYISTRSDENGVLSHMMVPETED